MDKKNRIIIGIGIAIVLMSTFSFYVFFLDKPEPDNVPDASERVPKSQDVLQISTEYVYTSEQDPDTEKSYVLPEDAVKPPEWDETEQDYTAFQEGFYLEGFPEELIPFINGDLEGLQNSIQTVLYNNGFYNYQSAIFGENLTFDYSEQEILFPVIVQANETVNLAVTYRRSGGTWHVEPY